jgi:hypothetical protein
VTKLREIEHGPGLLAAGVEELLGTRPINLLYWRQGLRDAIAELEHGTREATSGTLRSRMPGHR